MDVPRLLHLWKYLESIHQLHSHVDTHNHVKVVVQELHIFG